MDTLRLIVQWPSRRTVHVHVYVKPLAGPVERVEVRKARKGPVYWDQEALASNENAMAFLRRITRAEPAGATVMTWVFENMMQDLYELLQIEGSQEAPVLIRLPADG